MMIPQVQGSEMRVYGHKQGVYVEATPRRHKGGRERHLEDIPADGIIAQQVAEELCHIAKLVGFQPVNQRVLHDTREVSVDAIRTGRIQTYVTR